MTNYSYKKLCIVLQTMTTLKAINFQRETSCQIRKLYNTIEDAVKPFKEREKMLDKEYSAPELNTIDQGEKVLKDEYKKAYIDKKNVIEYELIPLEFNQIDLSMVNFPIPALAIDILEDFIIFD